MNVRTLDELVSLLDGELAWRKKELSIVKLSIDRAPGEQVATFLRGGVCMLYAHWEGFIKAAATGYVCYVTRRALKYKELSDGFVALGLRSMVSRVGQSKNVREYIRMSSAVRSDAGQRLDINCERAIDVQSNLNSRVLADILCTFALDEKPYLIKAPLIDSRLLHNRNNVAHGRYLEIEVREYQTLHSEIVGLIDKFRDDVEDAAQRRLYRR